MSYSDPLLVPDGFEGVLIDATNRDNIKEAKAFEGFVISPVSNQLPKIPIALEGILIAYSDVERFIKVTDYRGTPLKDVKVTAQNVGGDVFEVTGSNGIVALQIATSGTTTIKLEKEKTFKTLSYTYASESYLKEIVFQPPLL